MTLNLSLCAKKKDPSRLKLICWPVGLDPTAKNWRKIDNFAKPFLGQSVLFMVFCYQNCSDLLWEKIVQVIKKNFWNSRLGKTVLMDELFCTYILLSLLFKVNCFPNFLVKLYFFSGKNVQFIFIYIKVYVGKFLKRPFSSFEKPF